MIQGTTPLHEFTFPEDPSQFSEIEIVYYQNGALVLRKTKADLTFGDENTASLRLSQDDTLKFCCTSKASIQVRVLTSLGEALASDIVEVSVEKILRKEVLCVENNG